jgi:TRAP-type C4-dicarboxylate transport system permease small subunit
MRARNGFLRDKKRTGARKAPFLERAGNIIKKLLNFLYHADDAVAGIALLILVSSAILGVFYRYVLSDPLKWVEEVSLACVVWFVFIGGSSATKRGAHVSIDFVIATFPRFVQKAACIAAYVVSFAVLLFMIAEGSALAMQAGLKVTNILRIPYSFIDCAVPIGCTLMLGHMVSRFPSALKALSPQHAEPRQDEKEGGS